MSLRTFPPFLNEIPRELFIEEIVITAPHSTMHKTLPTFLAIHALKFFLVRILTGPTFQWSLLFDKLD